MAIWIRTVYPQWFDALSSRPDLAEINLWTAAGRRSLEDAATGDFVLFRVKGRRGIAGYGVFFNAAIYFADDAWDIFGPGNGAATRDTFLAQVKERYSATGTRLYALECHNIVEPIYFSALRRRLPEEALRRMGSGPIDEDSADGELLSAFLTDSNSASFDAAIQEAPRRRAPLGQVRAGRSGFRIEVHKAYGRTCAITGETVLPSLEAVHFIADQFNGALLVSNATLLRRDLHPLLEQGYMAISADYKVLFSKWLPQAYPRCETYLAYNGKPMLLPQDRNLWPDRRLLERHRAFPFFKGGVIGQ